MTTDQLGPVPAPDAAARRRERRGWYFYDWANSTFYTSVITVFGAAYVGSVAAEAARTDPANGPNACGGPELVAKLVDCDISLLGLRFPAGALWGYLIGVATVVQVFIMPIAGAIADRSQSKRPLLATAAFTGAGATCLLVFVAGTNWQLAVPLYIVAQIGYGVSIVVYYAFLAEIAAPDERDEVSARGWAFGFLGGGVALAVQLGIYLGHEALGLTEGQAVRACFLLSGLWWAGFTVIPLRRLRDRRRPRPVEPGVGVIRAGFRELADTLREARAFPLTLGFLGAYLVFNDGVQTVVTTSAQYGKEELQFSQDTLIATILMVQFVAFVGGWLHGVVARRLGAKRTIMGSLALWIGVIVAAYFLEPRQEVPFYLVGAGIGLVLGGTVALARSLYSQMIPAGKEAQYFSLYEISERGTAWLGPVLFSAIGSATGSFRPAILALIVFFVAGIGLVALVPARRAIVAAGNTPPSKL
ncbi:MULTISPECIES: MFS transporter [Thermocrispum]|jgi:UMF1 family MFS transporter|uniref:MFS transporter n=1 Tax=Thermocrispum agreste TaxID=37925 RepID=A0A2W4LQN5_9PSEU|nr:MULTISPECIES: MFS transporter [Thermocrispum]PZM99923.1 MAG: MFS transporter [Thermocrispum agreste]